MPAPVTITPTAPDLDQIASFEGRVAIFVGEGGALDDAGKKADALTGGAVTRVPGSEAWEKLSPGKAKSLDYPTGLAATALDIVSLPSPDAARTAGASLGKAKGDAAQLVLLMDHGGAEELALGLMLRAYAFNDHKTADEKEPGSVALMTSDRKSTRLNSSHVRTSRMPSSA